MARVRGKDTIPERMVRKTLHRLGYRFRLHRRDLPGSPDVVLPKHRTALFVHGCFWHRHDGCRGSRVPKSNTTFWEAKFDRNTVRDARQRSELEAAGWRVVVVWECETKDQDALGAILSERLGGTGPGNAQGASSS